MLKNYFKTAWRNLLRNKLHSAINVLGMAAGISACLLIYFYILDERSFEKHFSKADRIYRIVNDLIVEGEVEKCSLTSYPLATNLQREYPEIEQCIRVLPISKRTVWTREQAFTEERICLTDSTFFKVFNYRFLAGDAQSAFQKPNGVVLARETAERLFGSAEAAYGQPLRFPEDALTVTGVVEQKPQSHLQFHLLASFGLLRPNQRAALKDAWGNTNVYTYTLLKPGTDAKAFESKLDAFFLRHADQPKIDERNRVDYIVQPIQDIHLTSDFLYEPTPLGNIKYLYIFGCVAGFILIIACINYMNLATARSLKRAREVGLRKVLGANRNELVSQFLTEGVLLVLIAGMIGIALAELLLPWFNELTDKQISFGLFDTPSLGLTLLGEILVVAGVASSYPAFYLSGFSPVEVFGTLHNPRSSSAFLRKLLVVVQFTISIILVVGTAVVLKQMHFLKNSDLGFTKEQVIVLDIPRQDTLLVNQLSAVKAELLKRPQIKQVATAGQIPSDETGVLVFNAEKNEGGMVEKTMNIIFADHDYFRLMDIQVVNGRSFSKEIATDEQKAVVINEAAAKALGWTDPIGKRLSYSSDTEFKVVGVVKDFHYKSLHNKIEPLVIELNPKTQGYILARVQPEDLPGTMAYLQSTWQKFEPKYPLETFFLDDYFNKQYRAEEKMLTVFGYFAGLTILIACLGLQGLVSFMAEQRTKEIGIRKVLGSTVLGIVLLLTRDYTKLVLIAIVLGLPLAAYGMQHWLEDFAYRTSLSWWVFAGAGVLAMLIALVTVGLQAMKAAYLNPINALRSE